jgi:hypothetical protein
MLILDEAAMVPDNAFDGLKEPENIIATEKNRLLQKKLLIYLTEGNEHTKVSIVEDHPGEKLLEVIRLIKEIVEDSMEERINPYELFDVWAPNPYKVFDVWVPKGYLMRHFLPINDRQQWRWSNKETAESISAEILKLLKEYNSGMNTTFSFEVFCEDLVSKDLLLKQLKKCPFYVSKREEHWNVHGKKCFNETHEIIGFTQKHDLDFFWPKKMEAQS